MLFLSIWTCSTIRFHVTGDKTVDHVASAINQITFRVNVEVTIAAQQQTLGVRDAGLIAHHEEAVALNGHVAVEAGGLQVHGRHVQINCGNVTAVADLTGVGAAADLVAVGAAGLRGVDALTEGDTTGLVAVGVDVGYVVAHNVQGIHLGFHAGNTCAHST